MFKSILSTATWKQSQITTIGTLINGFLGALFYIILARYLGPTNFGLFVVSVAVLTLTADIVDFGTNTGLIRFVSAHLVTDKSLAFKFLKLSLVVKLIVWLIVLMFGLLLAPVIAIQFLNKAELVIPLRFVFIGVGGMLFFTFATSALQAYQRFFAWSFINITTNLFRLVFILILIVYMQLNLMNGLIIYIALPFIGFFLTLFLLPTKEIFITKDEFSVAKQFFKYNRWVALFVLIAAFSSRLDTFLSSHLLTAKEVGIYSAANQLTSVIPQLIGALGVVSASKFASFQNKQQMLMFFKKFQLMVTVFATLGLLLIPISYYLIPIIYGEQYSLSVIPFAFLLIGMLIFLISIPIHNSIIYYFSYPQLFVWVSIGHLLIIGFLGYFMISTYGVIGASVTVLIGMLFNLIAPLIWFINKLKYEK